MAIIKCKMCGGDIELSADKTYGTCDSCGSTMTFPKVDDEHRANLFNRANHFRRQNEFDKAVTAYERILEEDNNDAEAHWGVVLSRFGIEYVEDPVSHDRIPTCHRVQTASILTDADYLAALEHAPDEYSRSLYEAEAKRIAEIQKGILAISALEKPYDVFICYKESTDGGSRTKDSTLAQDIYYQLKQEGVNVFFSRITLEEKLGQQYEPYIFAALNSAKVMLVVGTKAEYFNAVWVKNEWSRYLALMKQDRSRLLIPCYMNMDPYDLPEELSALQSQDMSKIGFMQDLIRGVKKVLGGNTKGKGTEESSAHVPGISSLLKRARLFLEDNEFESANEYAEKVLDIDPECAEAYLLKALVTHQLHNEDELRASLLALDTDANFIKAMRFADEEQKQAYAELRQAVTENIRIVELENNYQKAQKAYQSARSAEDYAAVAGAFTALADYKDAVEISERCASKAAQLRKERAEQEEKDRQRRAREAAEQAAREEELKLERQRLAEAMKRQKEQARRRNRKLLTILAAIVVVVLAAGLSVKEYFIPMKKYKAAVALLDSGNLGRAIQELTALEGFGDSEELLKNAYFAKGENELQAGNYEAARQAYYAAGDHAGAQTQLKLLKDYTSAAAHQTNKNYTAARKAFALLDQFLDSAERFEACCAEDYAKATKLRKDGKAGKAYALFADLGDYSDCAAQMRAIIDDYAAAGELLASGDYSQAAAIYLSLGDYEDSATKAFDAQLQEAEALLANGQYEEAIAKFSTLKQQEREQAAKDARDTEYLRLGDEAVAAQDYGAALDYYLLLPQTDELKAKEYILAQSAFDAGFFEQSVLAYEKLGQYELSVSRLPVARYAWADQLDAAGRYEEAAAQFKMLGGFTDSANRAKKSTYEYSKQLMEAASYTEAKNWLFSLGNYEDAATLVKECDYRKAVALMNAGNYTEASSLFGTMSTYSDSKTKKMECDYALADAAFTAGDYASARNIYATLDQYADADDKEKKSTYMLADEYFTASAYSDAQKLYETLGQYEDSEDMIKECHLQRALVHQQNGDYSKALAELQGLDYRNSVHVAAECNKSLGDMYLKNGQTAKAISYYVKAALLREAQDMLYTLGKDYATTNQMEEAIETLYFAGNHEAAQQLLNEIGDVLATNNQKQLALVAYWAAGGEVNATARNLYPAMTVQDMEEAVRACEVNGGNAENFRYPILYRGAQWLFEEKAYAVAEQLFTDLQGYQESQKYLYDIANIWLNEGKWDEASKAFEHAGDYSDAKTRIPEAYYKLAESLMADEKWDEASATFELAGDYSDAKDRILEPFYKRAEMMLTAGNEDEAIAAFQELEEYRDAATRWKEIVYRQAERYVEEENWGEAYWTWQSVSDYKDSTEKASALYAQHQFEIMSQAKIGDYVLFGHYEQDGDLSNGKEPIEWLVLDKKDNRILVISRYGLDCKPYNTAKANITWQNCTLRKWLNGEFLNSAFSTTEKNIIPAVTVPAHKNPNYKTKPGEATKDKVFLLSTEEAEKYFDLAKMRKCEATTYAKNRGAWVSNQDICWWWLRTPGAYQNQSVPVLEPGNIYLSGHPVNYDCNVVRPAMWINLE